MGKERRDMEESTSIRGRAEVSKRCKKEQRKILKILRESGLNEEKTELLSPMIENISWMKIKLDDARGDIGEEGLTAEYDNGGGQKGIREHPAFKAYEALWKSYSAGLGVILSSLPEPEGAAEQLQRRGEAPSALELVLGKRREA